MTKAEHIAKALNGKKSGSGWMSECPVHDEKTASLSIRDHNGFVGFKCFGCGATGREIIPELVRLGIWENDCDDSWKQKWQDQKDAEARTECEIFIQVYESAKPSERTEKDKKRYSYCRMLLK